MGKALKPSTAVKTRPRVLVSETRLSCSEDECKPPRLLIVCAVQPAVTTKRSFSP